MLENPIPVTIGDKVWLCPPMPFYCLERAWPFITAMGEKGKAMQRLAAAQLQVRMAVSASEHDEATANVIAATEIIEQSGADFIGQTKDALEIIVSALALDATPPSYIDLAKLLRPSEIQGVHLAVAELLEVSGLKVSVAGEALATIQEPAAPLNGVGSSLN